MDAARTAPAKENEIDRSKSCPHLLRLFWKNNRNNPQLEYKSVSLGKFPSNEIQIYTWPDATLREISDLLKSTVAVARQRHVTLSFDLVYPDRNGVHVVRHVSDLSALGLFNYDCTIIFCFTNAIAIQSSGGKGVVIKARTQRQFNFSGHKICDRRLFRCGNPSATDDGRWWI